MPLTRSATGKSKLGIDRVDAMGVAARAKGAPTGKKRGRPRKHPELLKYPSNIVAPIEPAQPGASTSQSVASTSRPTASTSQPIASTSQPPVAQIPPENFKANKRPRNSKNSATAKSSRQQSKALVPNDPKPSVSSTPALPMVISSAKGKERMRQEDVDAMIMESISSAPALPVVKSSAKGKERMRQEDVDVMMTELGSSTRDENLEAHYVEQYLLPPALVDNGSISTAKGKKRARNDHDPPEVSTSKRIKIANASTDRVKTVTVKKAKDKDKVTPSGTTGKGKRSAPQVIQGVKWKVLEPLQPEPAASVETPSIEEPDLRPRIWANNRDELLAMMPEMSGSKCYNGISWAMYETPMLLLDGYNPCFQIERNDKKLSSLDLITTRSFVCQIPQEFDIQKSSVIDVPSPPSPFIAPIFSTEQSSGGKLKQRQKRRFNSPPTTKKQIPTQTVILPASDPECIDAKSSLQTSTTRFEKPILPEPLLGRSSTNHYTNVTHYSAPMRYPGPPVPNYMTLGPRSNPSGSPYVHQGYQTQRPPPFVEGSSSRPLGPVAPPMASAGGFLMNNHSAQTDNFRTWHQPSQFTPTAPSFEEYNNVLMLQHHGSLGNIYSYPGQFPPPFSTGQQSLPHDFPHPPENPIPSSVDGAPSGRPATDVDFVSQHQSVMIGEDSDAMQMMYSEESKPVVEIASDSILRDYVPSPLPEELGALADSYLFGRPLTILISNALLEKHWSLKLPSEYGYAMMGYFKIVGMQETRVHTDSNESLNKAPHFLSGQVQWKFHLQWAPGGEESILAEGHTFDLQRPWWDPLPRAQEPSTEQPTKSLAGKVAEEADDPESSFATTPRYRNARLRHHEYKFRHLPLDGLYNSLIPFNLLIPFGEDYLDTSFPLGWFCKDCGRMNFQAALRHRGCPSSFCKDKPPPVAPYAPILFLLRDPQERLPLSAPLNHYPEKLTTTAIERFPSGMQTFSYHLVQDSNVFMKHIFTSNAPPLQEGASDLLRDIQINVPIVRPLTETSPYFFWEATSPKDNSAPTDTEWENILPTMNQAKELIVSSMRSFGGLKEQQVAVNHMRMFAWITAGSKKSADLIKAKNKPVVFFALGCTVVLVVTPKRMTGTTIAFDKSYDAQSGEFPKNDIIDHDDTVSGWIVTDNHENGAGAEDSIEIPKKGKAIAKSSKPSFVITLMHGDMIVFYGDEFEYSVKRDGTSLLLIASHDSLEHA